MRKSFMILALAASVMLVGCNKEKTPTVANQKDCRVYVEIVNGSKATLDPETLASNEGKVNSLQVFIFDNETEERVGYGQVGNGATALEVLAKTGQMKIRAVVNAPDLSEIETLEALENVSTTLASQDFDNFIMFGSAEKFIEGNTTVNIDVYRGATRVVIREIENAFKFEEYQKMEFIVKGIYLINVQGANNLSNSAYQGDNGTWYNKMKYETSDVDDMLYDSLDETIAYGSSYKATHTFYGMPNDFDDADINGGNWSARYTRLVIEATLDGTTMYYPINMDRTFAPNTSYEIEKLIVTQPGSSDPDTPVDSDYVTFSITVKPWDVVLMGNGGTVTI